MSNGIGFRLTTWFVGLYPRIRWGVDTGVTPLIVKNLGPVGALKWVKQNARWADRIRKEMGGMRANFALAVASLLNGCAYCLYAHARAFELYYFEQTGKLFPIDQHDFLSLIPLTDESAQKRLENALVEAGLPDEVQLFRRLYALKLEGLEPTKDDELLVRAIEMYDMLNYCAIDSQVELDDAHDTINKNAELKARYAEARLMAGRRQVSPEDIAAVDDLARSQATEAVSTPNDGVEPGS